MNKKQLLGEIKETKEDIKIFKELIITNKKENIQAAKDIKSMTSELKCLEKELKSGIFVNEKKVKKKAEKNEW